MASITADYPGGGYRTRVSEVGGTTLPTGGGVGDLGWLMDLARRRANQRLKAEELAYDESKWAFDEARNQARNPATLATQWMGDQNRVLRRGTERKALQAAGAEAGALTSPAPTRYNYGPGIVPGRSLDPLAMSGAQRRTHLPQSAHEIGEPVSTTRSRYRAATGGSEEGRREALKRFLGQGYNVQAPARSSLL